MLKLSSRARVVPAIQVVSEKRHEVGSSGPYHRLEFSTPRFSASSLIEPT